AGADGRFPGCGKNLVDYFTQAWILSVARMKLNQTCRAFLIQEKIADVIGNCFSRRQRVERRISANAKVFAGAAITGRARWDQTQKRLRLRDTPWLTGRKH